MALFISYGGCKMQTGEMRICGFFKRRNSAGLHGGEAGERDLRDQAWLSSGRPQIAI